MQTLILTDDEFRALKVLLKTINEGLEIEAEGKHDLDPDGDDAPFTWIYNRVITNTKPAICSSEDEAMDIATEGFEGMLRKVYNIWIAGV